MCQLAFAHLNHNNAMSSQEQQLQQTKVVISDAECMSWESAVKDVYVLDFVNCGSSLDRSQRIPAAQK